MKGFAIEPQKAFEMLSAWGPAFCSPSALPGNTRPVSVQKCKLRMTMQADKKTDEEKDAAASHSSMRLSGKAAEVAHLKPDTVAIRGGHHPSEWTTDPLGRSVVNPPVYHASTIVFPNMEALRFSKTDWPFTGMWYGRHGNPTTFALEEAFAALEGADNACLTSSGSSAVNAALLAFVKQGDHVLMTDAVYDPHARFLRQIPRTLRRLHHLLLSDDHPGGVRPPGPTKHEGRLRRNPRQHFLRGHGRRRHRRSRARRGRHRHRG